MDATPDTTKPDASADAIVARTTRAVSVSVLAFTAIYAVTAVVLFAPRVAIGVFAGGVIACLNFLVLARIGQSITKRGRDAAIWGGVYLLKIGALFGGIFLLLRSGAVGAIGVIVGFSALLPGIVVGGLLAGRAAPGPETPPDPTPSSSAKDPTND